MRVSLAALAISSANGNEENSSQLPLGKIHRHSRKLQPAGVSRAEFEASKVKINGQFGALKRKTDIQIEKMQDAQTKISEKVDAAQKSVKNLNETVTAAKESFNNLEKKVDENEKKNSDDDIEETDGKDEAGTGDGTTPNKSDAPAVGTGTGTTPTQSDDFDNAIKNLSNEQKQELLGKLPLKLQQRFKEEGPSKSLLKKAMAVPGFGSAFEAILMKQASGTGDEETSDDGTTGNLPKGITGGDHAAEMKKFKKLYELQEKVDKLEEGTEEYIKAKAKLDALEQEIAPQSDDEKKLEALEKELGEKQKQSENLEKEIATLETKIAEIEKVLDKVNGSEAEGALEDTTGGKAPPIEDTTGGKAPPNGATGGDYNLPGHGATGGDYNLPGLEDTTGGKAPPKDGTSPEDLGIEDTTGGQAPQNGATGNRDLGKGGTEGDDSGDSESHRPSTGSNGKQTGAKPPGNN